MILFYNRQASTGIRTEPKDVIACMKERGVNVLKKQQIRSWWSTYHQKRKQSLNTLISEGHTLQSATPTPTEQPTSVPTSTLLISQATTQTVAGASSLQPASIHVPSIIVLVAQKKQPHVSVASNSSPNTSPVAVTDTQTIQTSGLSVASSLFDFYPCSSKPFGSSQSCLVVTKVKHLMFYFFGDKIFTSIRLLLAHVSWSSPHNVNPVACKSDWRFYLCFVFRKLPRTPYHLDRSARLLSTLSPWDCSNY